MPREILSKARKKKAVCIAYIQAINDMFERVTTGMGVQDRITTGFPITVVLHQVGFQPLSLYTVVLDVLILNS